MSASATGPSSFAVRRQLTAMARGARKSLGQNFLNNPGVARRIVELAALGGDETVVEIGPGLGALSEPLAAACGGLWLIEFDRELAAQLTARFAAQSHVHVVQGDILNLDLAALLPAGAARVVANLPYNIGTAVITRLLLSRRFERIVVMVQLEVAKRLQAVPGSKDYGSLSVFTQMEAQVAIALRVSPGSFVPRPKVDSAVVVLEPLATPPVTVRDRRGFDRIVRTAFGQRRKQLGNSLKSLLIEPAKVLARAGLDASRRPETLTLAEFATLADTALAVGAFFADASSAESDGDA